MKREKISLKRYMKIDADVIEAVISQLDDLPAELILQLYKVFCQQRIQQFDYILHPKAFVDNQNPRLTSRKDFWDLTKEYEAHINTLREAGFEVERVRDIYEGNFYHAKLKIFYYNK